MDRHCFKGKCPPARCLLGDERASGDVGISHYPRGEEG